MSASTKSMIRGLTCTARSGELTRSLLTRVDPEFMSTACWITTRITRVTLVCSGWPTTDLCRRLVVRAVPHPRQALDTAHLRGCSQIRSRFVSDARRDSVQIRLRFGSDSVQIRFRFGSRLNLAPVRIARATRRARRASTGPRCRTRSPRESSPAERPVRHVRDAGEMRARHGRE